MHDETFYNLAKPLILRLLFDEFVISSVTSFMLVVVVIGSSVASLTMVLVSIVKNCELSLRGYCDLNVRIGIGLLCGCVGGWGLIVLAGVVVGVVGVVVRAGVVGDVMK